MGARAAGASELDQQVAADELTEFALDAALTAYRAQIAREHQYVDHRGIHGAGRAKHVTSMPLDDVYVMPLLLPENTQTEASERERVLLKRLDNRDLDPGEHIQLVEEYAALTGRRWRPEERAETQAAPVGEALSGARHAVVLGSPGVGKSALVRFLARVCARGEQRERLGWDEILTPVVIPLSAFAVKRGERPELTVRQFLEGQLQDRGGQALLEAATRELDAGRVLVLLDGVDEIPEHHQRLKIVRAVDQFLLEATGCRCLVTSRPHGYVPLAGAIPHFQLPHFTADQVETFVHNWQWASECSRHPEGPDRQAAETEADALLKELSRHPKVAELATNPLMLVIVSLIRYEQARLPEERVQLYERALETLLGSWNDARSLAANDVGGSSLPVRSLIEVWAGIAEWTRRTKPTGIIHRAELKRQLVEVLQERELDDEDPEATAESYLRAAAEHAGLLEERGPDVFAFWHATFEEYLAAIELTTPTSRATERLLPLRRDPRWREVLLLAVGRIGIVQRERETASEIIQAIADDTPGPLEPVLHEHLLLAAECVADDVGISRALAERIATGLINVLCELPYEPFEAAFIDVARALPKLQPRRDETIAALAALVEYGHWSVRLEAARWLGNITTNSLRAHECCEQLLTDEDNDVRCIAALGLARTGDVRPETWAAIIGHSYGFTQIESAVDHVVAASPHAKRVLRSLLASGHGIDVRLDAARMLMRYYHSDSDTIGGVRQAIHDLINDPKHSPVPPAIRILLAAIANDSEIIALIPSVAFFLTLSRLRDYDLWSLELQALNLSGKRNLTGITSLRHAAHEFLNDPEIDTRMVAALVILIPPITDWDAISQDAIDTVLPILANADPAARAAAASLLLDVGDNNPETITSIENTVRDLLRLDEYRFDALRVLQRNDTISDETIHAVRGLLPHPSPWVRANAIQLLLSAGQDDADVQNSTRDLLAEPDVSSYGLDTYAVLREKILPSLAEDATHGVQTTVRNLLDNPDSRLRLNAADLLLRAGEDHAAAALNNLLSDSDHPIRVRAATSLAEQGRPNMAVLETLAREISTEPWAALAACQKLLNREELTAADGQALASLLRFHHAESAERRRARQTLFDWVSAQAKPQSDAERG